MKHYFQLFWPPIAVFFLTTAIAELAVRLLHVPAWLLPPPSQVAAVLWLQRHDLFLSFLQTAQAAALGLLFSALIGTFLAIILNSSKLIRRAFYPYTVFFQTVPIVAIAPLLVLWFDFGIRTVTACVFIVSIFPIIANTLTGLLSADPALLDMFRLYHAPWHARLLKLQLPSALPSIVTGWRIAAGLAVIGAIVGEMFAGTLDNQGLGILLLESKRELETSKVFAIVLCSAALGLLLFATISILGWFLLHRWHVSEQ